MALGHPSDPGDCRERLPCIPWSTPPGCGVGYFPFALRMPVPPSPSCSELWEPPAWAISTSQPAAFSSGASWVGPMDGSGKSSEGGRVRSGGFLPCFCQSPSSCGSALSHSQQSLLRPHRPEDGILLCYDLALCAPACLPGFPTLGPCCCKQSCYKRPLSHPLRCVSFLAKSQQIPIFWDALRGMLPTPRGPLPCLSNAVQSGVEGLGLSMCVQVCVQAGT